MKILLLGSRREKLIGSLQSLGDYVVTNDEPINAESAILTGIDYIISYGFRYMIRKDILNLFPGRIINLHISHLPWNRGADPNLWSFLEDTPKGVSIHFVDEGLDTGDILAQKEVPYTPADTLRTMYERLAVEIEDLLVLNWEGIRCGAKKAFLQPEGGSYHKLSDRERYSHLLSRGWDTPVMQLLGKAKQGFGEK